jgi:hypothetical protein
VRRPLSRSGFDQWKPFEQWLDPLKQALGPALEHWADAPLPKSGRNRDSRVTKAD